MKTVNDIDFSIQGFNDFFYSKNEQIKQRAFWDAFGRKEEDGESRCWRYFAFCQWKRKKYADAIRALRNQ